MNKVNASACNTQNNIGNTQRLGRRSAKQGGFGALEVMIAIVIGIIVLIGATAWNSKLTNTANNNNEFENVQSLISSTRQFKTSSGYGTSGANLIPNLITAEGIPETMQKTSNSVFNAWGGAVTNTSTGTGFTLTYAGVPDSNCIFLATKLGNSNAISVRINGGAAIVG
ncbi:type 4 pilus major pilin, partial [Pseudomonas chlororaphis]|uniref:type 4 pilus major pilin n=1 Tax=Pseudomonas chlororaphis TaxID=587753 RepID=UPI002D788FFE